MQCHCTLGKFFYWFWHGRTYIQTVRYHNFQNAFWINDHFVIHWLIPSQRASNNLRHPEAHVTPRLKLVHSRVTSFNFFILCVSFEVVDTHRWDELCHKSTTHIADSGPGGWRNLGVVRINAQSPCLYIYCGIKVNGGCRTIPVKEITSANKCISPQRFW